MTYAMIRDSLARVGAALLLAGGTAVADELPDKAGYHLLRPVPADLMREFSTDRPDKTESAYTVDAGHFQIEADLVTWSHDRSRGARTDGFSIAPVNLKAGLLNAVDLQVVLETFNVVHSHAAGTRETQTGFGDITTRLKVNLWGNDGGPTALALMPFLKIPTNQQHLGNHAVEGGLIIPLAIELPKGFGMGLMTEFDFNEDADGDGYHPEFINSVTVGHDIVGDLGGYVEFFTAVSDESPRDWQGTVDLGLTYGLTDNVQLDCGVNLGVTDSADDVNPFLGIAWRR